MSLDALEQLAGERNLRRRDGDGQLEWAVPWAIWIAAGATLVLVTLIAAAL